MKLIFILPIMIILAASTGCDSHSTGTAEHSENHPSHNEAATINLNKGQKWKVDDNMRQYIQQMELDVKSFAASDQKDYDTLATTLQQNIKALTTSCTMEGEAHEELHKWLVPYMALVNEFALARSEKEAAAKLHQIESAFENYYIYFL